jgi:SNF family Na+-dependent transporter
MLSPSISRNAVLEKSDRMEDLGYLNTKVMLALGIAWVITALCLIRGVKWIGRISLFTATFPYFIIAVLFIRGVTLDGSIIGMNYYIFDPDFSTVWNPTVHTHIHVCFFQ